MPNRLTWLAGIPRVNSLPGPGAGSTTNQATEVLRQMGPQAVPVLVKMLRARDSVANEKAKAALNRLLAEQHCTQFRYRCASEDRIDALKGVFVLGPEARTTIPEVKRLLDEGLETREALFALARIGPEAVPVLLQVLTNRVKEVRLNAAGVLTHFRDQGEVIVPALTDCLDDPDQEVRNAVALHLGFFGPMAHPAFTRLLQMAESLDYTASSQAVRTWVALDCEGTLRVFLKKLESSEPAVRANYAQMLRYFGHQGRPAVPALTRCLRDEDQAVRRAAAIALGEIGEEPGLAVPALMGTLQDQDLWLRTFAGIALGSFGSEAKAAAPTIVDLIEEHKTNESYRAWLRASLKRIDPKTAVSVEMK